MNSVVLLNTQPIVAQSLLLGHVEAGPTPPSALGVFLENGYILYLNSVV